METVATEGSGDSEAHALLNLNLLPEGVLSSFYQGMWNHAFIQHY